MGSRRTVAAALAAVLVCTVFLGGCTPVACAGAADELPHLELSTQEWFAAHPDSTIRVCLGGKCQTITSDDAGAPTHLYPRLLHGRDGVAGPWTVTVDATGGGQTLARDSRKIRFASYTQDQGSPCGSMTLWRATADLTAVGKIELTHVPAPPM